MATSSLGRLTLDLAVRLSEFTDGMSRAERETQERMQNMQASVTSFRENLAEQLGGTQIGGIIQGLNGRFGSLEGGIGRTVAAIGGMAIGGIAVSIGALSAMAIETAKADTQMAMLANRANISLQSFQVLTGAAQGLGYEQEQLADIFADLQEKLGEFSATEGGGAADFFDALRNNTKMTDDQIKEFGKTLQGKDGVEAVQLIKNKMDELGASSQEQRFVFESLASDLTNLLPLFEKGGKLLGEYGEALQDAGVIKSKQAIEQSQLLAAQMQATHQRFDGFKSQLAGQMIPILGALTQHFLGSGKQGTILSGIIQGVGLVAKGVAAVILTFSTAIGLLGNTIGQYMAQLSNVGRTAINVWNADGAEAKAQAIVQGFTNAKNMGEDFWKSQLDFLKRADDTMGGIVNGQIVATDKLAKANLALGASQLAVNDGLSKTTKQAEAEKKALEKAAKEKEKAAKDVPSAVSVASTAAQDIGISEKTNPNRIMGYQRAIGYASNRIDAWCASFVGAALEKNGFASTRSASARSYDNYGVALNKNKTIPTGAIGTIARNGGSGRHVFIVEKDNGDGTVTAINGNWGGAVKRDTFSKSRLTAVRLPVTKNGKVADTSINATSLSDMSRIDDDRDKELKNKADEAKRLAEELEKNKLSIIQKYATQAEKIETEHKKNLALINKTYAENSVEWAKFTTEENKSYESDKAEYQKGLQDKLDALEKYKASELSIINKARTDAINQAKKDFADDPSRFAIAKAEIEQKWRYDIDQHQAKMQKQRNELLTYTRDERQIIADGWDDKIADAKLANDELVELRVKSFEEQRDRELELFDIKQAEEQLAIKKNNLATIEYINQKYDLIDRREAASKGTPEQKAINQQTNWENRNAELVDTAFNANANYRGMMAGLHGQTDIYNANNANTDERQSRMDIVEQARSAGLIQAEEYNNALLEIDKAYLAKKQEIWASQYSGVFSSLTSTMGTFFGEQSKMYRAAAAMQQGYAVFQAMMAVPKTYSDTLASLSAIPLIGPYIAPPMAAAAAAMQVAQAAKIRGMAPPSIGGVAHGGMDYIPKETTFLLDKGERVLSPRQNSDLTRYLNDRQNSDTGSVNVYNNSSAQVTGQKNPDGTVTIDVVDKMIKQSFGRIAQPNSFESRQITKHTTARFNRQ